MRTRLLVILGVLLTTVVTSSQIQAKEVVGASWAIWSPDGQHITYVRWTGTTADLYMADTNDAGHPRKLTDQADSPVWSVDSQQIAFVVVGKPPQSAVIKMIRIDGSDLRTIVEGYSPAWSADGRRLFFLSNSRLFVANADGSNAHALIQNQVWAYWISPDATHIAAAKPLPGTAIAEIGIIQANGSNYRKLAESSAATVSWAPDSQRLVLVGDCGVKWSTGLCIVDSEGRLSLVIPYSGLNPRWSPDGSQIAFSLNGGLYLINADGSNAHWLTPEHSNDMLTSWSPDGKRLLFQRGHYPDPGAGEPYVVYFEICSIGQDGSNLSHLPDGVLTL